MVRKGRQVLLSHKLGRDHKHRGENRSPGRQRPDFLSLADLVSYCRRE
jgi:hypothetical protein